MNPPLKNFPPGIRIMLMFCMLFVNLAVLAFVTKVIMMFFWGIDKPEIFLETIPQTFREIEIFLFVQVFILQGSFVLTAVMFSKLEAASARERLKINSSPPVKMIVLAIISIIVAQFFIEFLVEVNNKIPLPQALNFLKDQAKQTEDLLNALTNFKQPGQFIIISLFIAAAPALCEEMFFRGLLLGALLRGRVSPFPAILLSGFIFAVSHMEYNNTIAIWALGAFLGYLYYISGSIWLPVAAHFTNNFLDVLLKYLYNIGVISKNIADAATPLYITALSVILFSACIYVLNKWKQPEAILEMSKFENE